MSVVTAADGHALAKLLDEAPKNRLLVVSVAIAFRRFPSGLAPIRRTGHRRPSPIVWMNDAVPDRIALSFLV